ncbi:MAG: outer membrane protein transport protein [Bacteroidales bacterium]|jgi:hypothetical protein|nr:outer membrane protein transport protein [Bacteroidales bacterium]
MKRIIFLIISIVALSSFLYSQNEIDALRYSHYIPGSTSRANAMGGSFGALGGDASVLGFNPAGMGVYKSSDFSITPGVELINSSADYLGRTSRDYSLKANLSNISLIGTINLKNETGFSNVNFGFSYNRLNSFNENILIEGINNENSFSDWLAARGNGIYAGDLGNYDNFYSYLGYHGFLIDPYNRDSISYISALDNLGQTQRQFISRSGNQGEYNFSISGSIQHKLFLGASIGIQTVKYDEKKRLEEIDTDNTIPDFNSFSFVESLSTTGTGVNFKIGFLYSPVEWIRFGGALHTPTYFSLRDTYETSVQSSFESWGNTERIYSNIGIYNYELTTPLRANFSLGFIINKQFLVNVDYEYVNYSKSLLRSDDYTFSDENNTIKNAFKSANNVRLGAEYRYGPLSFRLGAAYYDSPYKSSLINKSAYTFVYSAGLGTRWNNTYLDLSYSFITNSYYYSMYSGYGVNSPLAEITNNGNRITATIGFKF